MKNLELFKDEILQLIYLKQEGGYWDFKRQWHTNRSDLLHDIICMANNLTNKDGLLIIGVDEETDYSICDIQNDPYRKNTQNMVDFLHDKKFAGGIRPTVYVQSLSINEKTIDIIVIRNDRNTPYFLTEEYNGVYANNIYTRVMDTNTPKKLSADINNIEKLWKKRFGIDATAKERALLFLHRPDDWEQSGDNKQFYKYYPEFTIEDVPDYDRQGYEFFLFNQCNPTPHWYNINIYYHQTLLYKLLGLSLDSGNYFTSAPKLWGISLSKDTFHNWDITYRYFIKNSIEYVVHKFFIKNDNHYETTARFRFLECILVFDSEREKSDFEDFVINNYPKYNIDDFNNYLPNFPSLEGYNMEALKQEYLQSQLLQIMLSDFRTEKNTSQSNV